MMILKGKNEGSKSKMRSKSTRKPLRDVSNSTNAVKSVKNTQKQEKEEIADNNNAQDCLLLVHSDISSLLNQIDELVVQALQTTSTKGGKEIKQFSDVLSEMHTSLKPWLPRIQKALSNPPTQTEFKSEQPKEEKSLVCVPEEDTDLVIESPEQTKRESLISPSPLVTWRGESKTERGRQLFLLTPLHKSRLFSAKRQVSSVPANEKITSDATLQPVTNLTKVSGAVSTTNSTLNKAFNSQTTKTITHSEKEYALPAKFSNCSNLVMMTPSLQLSPPKSCVLLEPVSEFAKRKNLGKHKSTPFPTRTQNSADTSPSLQLSPPKSCVLLEPVSVAKKKNLGKHKSTPFPTRTQYSGDSSDSDSPSRETDDDFNMKYPELFGIKLGNRTKVLEESPGWDISPPITCTIMEPPTDDLTLSNLPADVCLPKTTDHEQGIVESTPMVKEPASIFRVGKHPGENTLKRELWVRFDEATTPHGIRFTDVPIDKTSKKGFLDKLEEVSDIQSDE